MDPFTQRMRERARLRKAMNSGSAAEGQEEMIRSPLKEQNKTHKVKITTEEVTYSNKTHKESKQAVVVPEEQENAAKCSGDDVSVEVSKRTDVRDRLQRLGALYSGSPSRLSSPIQRTEQHFSSEPVRAQPAPARSARLAALAQTINQWEDDLATPATTRAEEAVAVETVTAAKPAAWDASLMDSLEGQGFARSKSNARLEFAFRDQEAANKAGSPKKAWLNSPSQSQASNVSPEKRPPALKSVSPRKGTAVLAAAQLIEAAGSAAAAVKDPAMLSLSDRAALFERQRGPPPIPRCPFGQPLPRTPPAKTFARPNAASSPEKKVAVASATTGWTPQKVASFTPQKPACNANFTPQKAASNANFSPQKAASNANFSPQKAASNANFTPQKVGNTSNNMVGAMQAMFASGGGAVAHRTIQEQAAAERKREMDALLNRWNDRADDAAPQTPHTQTSCPPAPPPLPSAPPAAPNVGHAALANVGHGSVSSVAVPVVGRIRVSPPKPGRIYPCLSDIDATETEEPTDSDRDDDDDSSAGQRSYQPDSSAEQDSFGRSILAAVGAARPVGHGQSDSDSESDQGPTPPKKTRHTPQTSSSSMSHSFQYVRGGESGEPVGEAPLLHTVSFYRRQQAKGKTSPVKSVPRGGVAGTEPAERGADPSEGVAAKTQRLLEEVGRQQTVISQASRALNLCNATVEFSGSREAVEAERLLLLAHHRRQAALNEVQRLKVEGSLKPLTEFGQTVQPGEKGVLTLRDISLPLKKDFLRNMDSDPRTHHFVVLAKYLDQVLATQAGPASRELVFPGPLRLVDLYSDFKLRLEVYTLSAQREMLPHDVKYHIHHTKKEGKRLTPKKRAESRLVMPGVESPAGPGAVRSPAFSLAGFVVFSLKELRRTNFTLNTVSPGSPLEGRVGLRLETELSMAVCHRGFLTVFQDVSGFGAWHRRWCVLQGSALSFWKYPDDEKKKVPLGCIELRSSETKTAAPVSRDICARLHTFCLETSRLPLPSDGDSLIMTVAANKTILRHLLAADTKEDLVEWCAEINKALGMLRAWTNSAE